MHKKVNAVSVFFIICICSLLTGCSALSFIEEAWEDDSDNESAGYGSESGTEKTIAEALAEALAAACTNDSLIKNYNMYNSTASDGIDLSSVSVLNVTDVYSGKHSDNDVDICGIQVQFDKITEINLSFFDEEPSYETEIVSCELVLSDGAYLSGGGHVKKGYAKVYNKNWEDFEATMALYPEAGFYDVKKSSESINIDNINNYYREMFSEYLSKRFYEDTSDGEAESWIVDSLGIACTGTGISGSTFYGESADVWFDPRNLKILNISNIYAGFTSENKVIICGLNLEVEINEVLTNKVIILILGDGVYNGKNVTTGYAETSDMEWEQLNEYLSSLPVTEWANIYSYDKFDTDNMTETFISTISPQT